MTVLLIMHWFNPVLWYAYRKMREDQELSCDAKTVSYIGSDEAKQYANGCHPRLFERHML
ncbi:hypothetical protein HMSSN036_68780 [Paenibacillus macerans]|nr:hypothetical protein HMSSN036_68780 [Paenibacillus macerans]